MRHSAATALAGRGVAVRTIAGRLGHANPNVTLRTYAYFLDVAHRDAADVMAGLGLSLGPADGASSRSEAPPSAS